MKHLFLAFATFVLAAQSTAQSISFKVDNQTGAIKELVTKGEHSGMNWILNADGTQYPWVTSQYGWGLGYMTVDGQNIKWEKPVGLSKNLNRATYRAGKIDIKVERKPLADGFCETYTFKNNSKQATRLTDLGIYTPFNDNYPDAETCMTKRCNAHIWAGGDAAYVELMPMSGVGSGIGLMLTQGRISDYDIWERGMDRNNSNFRGVFALCPSDTTLAAGKEMKLSWRIFKHSGTDNFYNKILDYGGVVVSSPQYVYQVGEEATVTLRSKKSESRKTVKIAAPGEVKVNFDYGKGKTTNAVLLGVSSYDGLIGKRVKFILDNQQLADTSDYRNGAFLVYDNARNAIYKNDDNRRSDDTDEGRERVGMGILLAKWYKLHPDERIKEALIKYAKFVRTQLQDPDYRVHHSALHKDWSRGYNYPWIADFYFNMYDITGNKEFALDGYRTMKAFFRTAGYGFYAIDIPVVKSLESLKNAGLGALRDSLLSDYKQTAEKFIATGLNFPKHEVNYEQSIVAPATMFMAEMYETVGDKSYLDYVKMMLKPLESFASRQPTYHMNEISIRHWDGYWFGKKLMFGDTFPHYWSTLNAVVYHYYSKATGDASYQKRAENIVRNNLCSFFEDGKASCAYLNPRRVNGQKAKFYDDFANDQDWALVFYLLINKGK